MNREKVLALRARGHGLAQRSADAALTGSVGLRSTRHRALSVRARVADAPADALDRSLAAGDLVMVFGARGTLMLVPAAEIGVFTAGVAPDGEASLTASLAPPCVTALSTAGMRAGDALALVIETVLGCLDAGPVPRGELAQQVTARLPAALVLPCRGRCPDPHVEDSLFRLAGTFGAMHFVRDSDLLVAGAEFANIDELRREFVRRYFALLWPLRSGGTRGMGGNIARLHSVHEFRPRRKCYEGAFLPPTVLRCVPGDHARSNDRYGVSAILFA